MGTYNEFSIQDVLPDLSKKQITIITNFQVDATSVDLSTVKFFNYDSAKLISYGLKVEGKNIIIDLDEYPTHDTRYYLRISGIKDALKRTLACNYDDYIKFFSDVITKVEILSPVFRESFRSRDFEVKLKATDIIDNLIYRVEVAIDKIFFSTIATIKCNGLNLKPARTTVSVFVK